MDKMTKLAVEIANDNYLYGDIHEAIKLAERGEDWELEDRLVELHKAQRECDDKLAELAMCLEERGIEV